MTDAKQIREFLLRRDEELRKELHAKFGENLEGIQTRADSLEAARITHILERLHLEQQDDEFFLGILNAIIFSFPTSGLALYNGIRLGVEYEYTKQQLDGVKTAFPESWCLTGMGEGIRTPVFVKRDAIKIQYPHIYEMLFKEQSWEASDYNIAA